MTFSSFNLHPQITAGVEALGYSTPTSIQRQAIPPVLHGDDVVGLAQTGTGKTAAFVLPILERLIKRPRGRIRALIIAPTRELAEQINDAVAAMGRQTHLQSLAIYGGVAIRPQIQRLRAGVEIVVACPGRLLDHIRQGTIRLSNLEVLVLDEADRMFDMGFLPDIRKIIQHVPAKRQTLLFSATMPDDIRLLADAILQAPVTVQVDHGKPANTVAHAFYAVEAQRKTELLLELLRSSEMKSVLIFTRTKHRARQVGRQLERAGYRAASLRGDLSQKQRQEAIDGFREGSYQVLVATDIAARGIDVLRISHVINYDMPDTADAYTHRIGRTGRAEKTGDAFTFMTREDGAMVRSIERILGGKLECRRLKDFDYKKPGAAGDPGPAWQRERPNRPPQGKPGSPRTRTAFVTPSKRHPVHRGSGAIYRGPVPDSSFGSRARNNRQPKPGPDR